MSEDMAGYGSAGSHASRRVFPTARPVVGGLAEGVAPCEPRQTSNEDTALSLEIDAILDRLQNGIPELHREMDDVLARIRRPVAA
jgi:hypothetical protein